MARSNRTVSGALLVAACAAVALGAGCGDSEPAPGSTDDAGSLARPDVDRGQFDSSIGDSEAVGDARSDDETGAPEVVDDDANALDGSDTTSPDAVIDSGGSAGVAPEVQAAYEAAALQYSAAIDTFCACYRDEAPYNGNDVACRGELAQLPPSWTSCDQDVAAEFPDEALVYYACRQDVAAALNTCFGGCGGRIAAVTGCVLESATSSVACGQAQSAQFVAAVEACHPSGAGT